MVVHSLFVLKNSGIDPSCRRTTSFRVLHSEENLFFLLEDNLLFRNNKKEGKSTVKSKSDSYNPYIFLHFLVTRKFYLDIKNKSPSFDIQPNNFLSLNNPKKTLVSFKDPRRSRIPHLSKGETKNYTKKQGKQRK